MTGEFNKLPAEFHSANVFKIADVHSLNSCNSQQLMITINELEQLFIHYPALGSLPSPMLGPFVKTTDRPK
jgi:hypothetical protein